MKVEVRHSRMLVSKGATIEPSTLYVLRDYYTLVVHPAYRTKSDGTVMYEGRTRGIYISPNTQVWYSKTTKDAGG